MKLGKAKMSTIYYSSLRVFKNEIQASWNISHELGFKTNIMEWISRQKKLTK